MRELNLIFRKSHKFFYDHDGLVRCTFATVYRSLRGLILSLLSILILAGTCPSFAEIQVQARINPQEIGVGESAQLVIQIIGKDEEVRDVREPEVPTHPLWELTGGWRSESMSSRLVKGPQGMEFKTQRSVQFQYEVYGLKPGEVRVDSIGVQVAGQTYRSNPISLRILRGGSQPRPTPPQGQGAPPGGSLGLDDLDEMEQMFQQLLRRRGFPGLPPPGSLLDDEDESSPSQAIPGQPVGPSGKKVVPPSKNDAFFIYLDVDKDTAYVGEQITAQWYLYTRGNLLSLDRLKFPDLKGFWKEIIEEVPALNFTPEVIDGVMYRKALLAAHALFPIKAGTAVIDEYKIKATVQLPDQLGFGLGSPYSYQKSSPRLPIKVKELPKDGEPSTFTGAVGDFVVAVEGPNQSVWPVGQVFRLNFKFSGRGNAKFIELPEIPWPEGLQVVETKSEARFFKNGTSVKDVEVLLMPKKPGVVSWPKVSLWFFSPEAHTYYERSLDFPSMEFQGEALAEGESLSSSGGHTSQAGQLSVENELPQGGKASFWSYSLLVVLYLCVVLMSLGVLWLLVRILWDFQRLQRREVFWYTYWNERMEAWQKVLKKKALSAADLAHEIQISLSRLVGGVSRSGEDSLPFSKLIELTPPSFQTELGASLKAFYAKLNQVAYAETQQLEEALSSKRGVTNVSFHSSDEVKSILEEASFLANKVLAYLEPK
jgi:hypothetical protein